MKAVATCGFDRSVFHVKHRCGTRSRNADELVLSPSQRAGVWDTAACPALGLLPRPDNGSSPTFPRSPAVGHALLPKLAALKEEGDVVRRGAAYRASCGTRASLGVALVHEQGGRSERASSPSLTVGTPQPVMPESARCRTTRTGALEVAGCRSSARHRPQAHRHHAVCTGAVSFASGVVGVERTARIGAAGLRVGRLSPPRSRERQDSETASCDRCFT